MNRMEEVVPSSEQFNPMEILLENETDEHIRAIRSNALIAMAKENPLFIQQLLLSNVVKMPEIGDNQRGVHAPSKVMGPRIAIKSEDIRPGMANIGYYSFKDNMLNTVIFTDVITKTELVGDQVHIYCNDLVIRESSGKNWFVQHIWEHNEVTRGTTTLRLEGAKVGDIVMEYQWRQSEPQMRYFAYGTGNRSDIMVINAFEGQSSALYTLSPALIMPGLPEEPIPGMPGTEPKPGAKPLPAEGEPGEPQPIASIPPMPGEVKDDWVKPAVKDWWIS
jgi:hypothetical protein